MTVDILWWVPKAAAMLWVLAVAALTLAFAWALIFGGERFDFIVWEAELDDLDRWYRETPK